MFCDNYILDEQGMEPVPEPNLFKWGEWFQKTRKLRVVKQEWVANVRVSTVFLGINYGWSSSRPILWETRCFSNNQFLNGRTDRCGGDRKHAQAMHELMVKHVAEHLAKRK